MNDNELDPEDISEGDVIQYEEKHRIACIIKVLGSISTGSDFVRFKAEVLEPIFGDLGVGDTFTFGYNPDKREDWSMYEIWKVKKPGAMTDYITGSVDIDRLQDYTDHLKEKYRDDD